MRLILTRTVGEKRRLVYRHHYGKDRQWRDVKVDRIHLRPVDLKWRMTLTPERVWDLFGIGLEPNQRVVLESRVISSEVL